MRLESFHTALGLWVSSMEDYIKVERQKMSADIDVLSPLVSVVIPLHNAERHLDETLESISAQSLKYFEAIMVDDGSTDSTAEIAARFSGKDKRFKLIRQENRGAAVARNKGMELARGRYLIFLDADDLFESSMLASMSAALEGSGADVCVCDSIGFDSNSGKPIESFRTLGDIEGGCHETRQLLKALFQVFEGVPWDKMYRRSFVLANGYGFQNLKKSNDNFFTFANLANSEKIYVLREKYVRYRCNAGGSIQDGTGSNNLCILRAADALYKVGVPEAARDSLATWSFSGYLRAFELSAAVSETLAHEVYACYKKDYEAEWGMRSRKPSSMILWQVKVRFWCERRLSFEGLFRAYSPRGDKRYESRCEKVIRLLRMFFLAVIKA